MAPINRRQKEAIFLFDSPREAEGAGSSSQYNEKQEQVRGVERHRAAFVPGEVRAAGNGEVGSDRQAHGSWRGDAGRNDDERVCVDGYLTIPQDASHLLAWPEVYWTREQGDDDYGSYNTKQQVTGCAVCSS